MRRLCKKYGFKSCRADLEDNFCVYWLAHHQTAFQVYANGDY